MRPIAYTYTYVLKSVSQQHMGGDRRKNAISPNIDLDQVVSKAAEVSLAKIAVPPFY